MNENSFRFSGPLLRKIFNSLSDDKAQIEKKFLANVKTLVLPYLNKLKEGRLNEKDKMLVSLY